MDAANTFNWNAPNSGKVSTLDLQGFTLSAPRVMFPAYSGGGYRLISTITAAGGRGRLHAAGQQW